MVAVDKAGDRLRLRLERGEADVLRQLIDELLELLRSAEADDRVSQRLFPDAYDSPEDTAAYNELVADQLRRDKIESLQGVREALGRGRVDVTLSREACERWLTALTDLRLALGTRLEITEQKMGADLDPQDPQAPWLAALHWLGWVQESMLQAVDS
jgi:Domain of unknown function (DUF2017)